MSRARALLSNESKDVMPYDGKGWYIMFRDTRGDDAILEGPINNESNAKMILNQEYRGKKPRVYVQYLDREL